MSSQKAPNRVLLLFHSQENHKICCHQMSDFKAKIRLIQFRLGLRPRARWGSLQRSPVLTVYRHTRYDVKIVIFRVMFIVKYALAYCICSIYFPWTICGLFLQKCFIIWETPSAQKQWFWSASLQSLYKTLSAVQCKLQTAYTLAHFEFGNSPFCLSVTVCVGGWSEKGTCHEVWQFPWHVRRAVVLAWCYCSVSTLPISGFDRSATPTVASVDDFSFANTTIR